MFREMHWNKSGDLAKTKKLLLLRRISFLIQTTTTKKNNSLNFQSIGYQTLDQINVLNNKINILKAEIPNQACYRK